ncbi:hypothetical protein SELMODRAFT_431311 [Selaginella moellendorffii]|uniref:Uncharacterized protein n=1 Tax=Selaginella moellendorffii TaxID=88036 RepID=D8TC68_SELML|nr:hypothetical protein SELMODRAFT_431311 [Selaginella moellendorffii]
MGIVLEACRTASEFIRDKDRNKCMLPSPPSTRNALGPGANYLGYRMGLWLKHGEGFGLVGDGTKLPVRAIAAFWKLDPATLCIGDDVLLADATGTSIFDVESIRQTAVRSGLGDGSSKDAAIIAQEEEEIQIPNWAEMSRKRLEASRQLDEEFRQVFFKAEGAIHAYHNRDDEELDATNRCGMVTLVRPDGTCVTSYACMKKKAEEESDGKRYVVCVDGRRYECVSEVAGGVGVLTPAQGCSQSFSACAVVAPMPGPWLTVVSASWDHDGNKKPLLVAGTSVGGDGGRFEDLLEYETSCQFPPYRHIMLSCDGAKIECGAPVMTPRGSLTGVVVGFGKLRNDKRRSKKLKPPYNFPITKGDFGRFFKGVPESIAEDCRAGVEVNCMYYNTVEGKIGFPAIEWRIILFLTLSIPSKDVVSTGRVGQELISIDNENVTPPQIEVTAVTSKICRFFMPEL